jgi:plasmid maintenance system antidote protein VapI
MIRKPTIADILRRTIKESGIPPEEIERETGIKRRTIREFLSGAQSMQIASADRLAEYFKLALVAESDRK